MLKVNKRHARARHELFSKLERKQNDITPAGIYLLKLNNRNTRTRCGICSKLTINIPERRQWRSKFRYATIVAIFWHNCGKLRPKLPEELNDEHVEKINIKTVIIYNNMPNVICNSYAELQFIWRILDCGTKFGQKKK